MTRVRIFLFRLWDLLRSRQMDRDIDDEITSHLAEATDEYFHQGFSPEDARWAAKRSFGGETQTKEVYRQVRSFMWLDDLRRDLRYALRTLRRSPARSIWVLQAAVGLVLLIGCVNLANLLLARGETRHREFAIRAALGASRARLLRQSAIESVLLAIAGGAFGLLLAHGGVHALIRVYPTSLPRTSEVTLDPLVLLFTFGVSMVTGVVFGLAPVIRTGGNCLMTALKEGGTKGGTGTASRHTRLGLGKRAGARLGRP